MITKKQLKQMIDNCWEAREQAWHDDKQECAVWFEKIFTLLQLIENKRTEEDKEYYPFWWIGQFKMPNGEGWLDFLRDKEE